MPLYMSVDQVKEHYKRIGRPVPAEIAEMEDAGERKSKYGNRKVIVDGIEFDSQKEANRYWELKWLERAGVIKDLELQPEFILKEAFRKKGKWYRPLKYIADFQYIVVETGEKVVEDVKGFETKVFKIKRKLFEEKYPDLELRLIS